MAILSLALKQPGDELRLPPSQLQPLFPEQVLELWDSFGIERQQVTSAPDTRPRPRLLGGRQRASPYGTGRPASTV